LPATAIYFGVWRIDLIPAWLLVGRILADRRPWIASHRDLFRLLEVGSDPPPLPAGGPRMGLAEADLGRGSPAIMGGGMRMRLMVGWGRVGGGWTRHWLPGRAGIPAIRFVPARFSLLPAASFSAAGALMPSNLVVVANQTVSAHPPRCQPAPSSATIWKNGPVPPNKLA
jgi:hypothetical protein